MRNHPAFVAPRGGIFLPRLNRPAYNRNRPESFHAKTNMPRENLLTLLADYETYARDVAIVQHRGYRRESYTYQKLLQQAANFCLELKSRNIRTGDRILLWAPNSAEWLVAFWGCLLRGAVVVPMDDAATPEFASRVATQAAVKLIVAATSHPPLASEAPSINLSDL